MNQRTKTSKAWMRRHVNDAYVKRAQTQGLRSRAAFKLIEIAGRDRLFRRGMTVVDLGSAPGGWSQVAAGQVAPGGLVIAVDRLEMAPIAGVTFIQDDFTAVNTGMRIEQALAGRALDLVICDMAPNISGVAASDQARSIALAEAALVKGFHGAGFEALVRSMRERLERVASRKPEAYRSESSEVYLLGLGLVAHARRSG